MVPEAADDAAGAGKLKAVTEAGVLAAAALLAAPPRLKPAACTTVCEVQDER